MKIKSIQYALFAMLITIFSSNLIMAQSDEINRAEFFGGYSHNRVDTGLASEDFDDDFNNIFGRRLGANGFNASITGNFSKHVGAKFDFAVHSKNNDFDFDGDRFTTKYRIENYLGGIQIKNNQKEGPRVKPFAHFLAGVARQTVSVESPALTDIFGETTVRTSSTNFALAVGGGLDIRAGKHIDIRVFQVDYNPTFVKDRDFDDFTLSGKLQNNVRFSFGIVIH